MVYFKLKYFLVSNTRYPPTVWTTLVSQFDLPHPPRRTAAVCRSSHRKTNTTLVIFIVCRFQTVWYKPFILWFNKENARNSGILTIGALFLRAREKSKAIRLVSVNGKDASGLWRILDVEWNDCKMIASLYGEWVYSQGKFRQKCSLNTLLLWLNGKVWNSLLLSVQEMYM